MKRRDVLKGGVASLAGGAAVVSAPAKVAEQFNQQPQLVAATVLMGNLSSLITIPVILWFIL